MHGVEQIVQRSFRFIRKRTFAVLIAALMLHKSTLFFFYRAFAFVAQPKIN